MKDSPNIHVLESDLEAEKQELREDLQLITEKARETRAELSPTNLVREKIFLLLGVSLALGFLIGYRRVPIEDMSKPVARGVLGTFGNRADRRSFWGIL
jgi:hypothetical protein